MKPSLVDIATIEAARLLAPLRELNNNGKKIKSFFKKIGWDLGEISIEDNEFDLDELTELVSDILDIISRTIESEDENEAINAAGELFIKVPQVIVESKKVAESFESFIDDFQNNANEVLGVTIADNIGLFAQRMTDYLLYTYLQQYHQRIYSVFYFVGLMEEEIDESSGIPIKTINWIEIPQLFTEPRTLANRVYKWGAEDFEGEKFLKRFELLLQAFSISGGIYIQNEIIRNKLQRADGDDNEVRMPLFQKGIWPESYTEMDLNLSPIPEKGNHLPGLFLYPYLAAGFDLEQDLSDNWKIQFKGNFKSNPEIGLELRPPANLNLVSNLIDEGNSLEDAANTHIEIGISNKSSTDDLTLFFGSSSGSRFGFKEISFKIFLGLENGEFGFATETYFRDLTLVINTESSDGFLQKILSGIKIETVTDLAVGISNKDGFYFRGSGALEINIPIHKTLGPIKIDSLFISVGIDQNIETIFATTFAAELGPISAAVKGIGLKIPIDFATNRDGNLGPLNVDAPNFKPPTGAGLALDAEGIVGGGFLEFDDINKRYTGILGLTFGEIGLTAIGLITTKMPDGTDGFSMLINIGIIFDPPIELFSGFTLTGVGGLIGVNRSMETEVLQRGIRNRTLDSILFPDPDTVVANAANIISDLRSVFPPAKERFVVGPMIKIGWGYPNLVTADIGVFIELPDPIRIVLMGQLEAMLPEKEEPIVTIHLDILGVIDFEKEELTFQASLYDSRMLAFHIGGDAAFLLGWGNDPRFGLSLGGFHPKFTPPPPPAIFSDLKRLSIGISSGTSFQLTCQAYQALTPNSFQFGARVDLFAKEGSFLITGFMGFEALFYFSPFSFEVWIGAGVKIKYEGHTLADVELSFWLSGPTPWSARGVAKINILFISVDAGFNVIWGRMEKAEISPEDPWEYFIPALRSKKNWGSSLPGGQKLVEVYREMEADEFDGLIVHPAGNFEIKQNVVPLDIRLDKFGNAPITGHNLFKITNFQFGENSTSLVDAEEYFSRGQFEELTSHQKLSIPSFELMKAGVRSASNAISLEGTIQSKDLIYEAIEINSDRTSTEPVDGVLDWEEAIFMVENLNKQRKLKRKGPHRRFINRRFEPKVLVEEGRYCIADAETLSRAELSKLEGGRENRNLSRAMADQIFKNVISSDPSRSEHLLVVPEFELMEEVA